MKFTIYHVKNGFLLNVTYSGGKVDSYVFLESERMTMFALIDKKLGDEPPEVVEPPDESA